MVKKQILKKVKKIYEYLCKKQPRDIICMDEILFKVFFK